MAISLELLSEIKEKLRITWNEDDTLISRLIESAQADLNGLCDTLLDYETEGKAKTLMFEHVFYDWNNALYEFRKNYQNELLELMLLTIVEETNDVPDE